MDNKINITDTFVPKPTPAYIPPVDNKKSSKNFNNEIAKYVIYHANNKKMKDFKKWWIIKICFYLVIVFILLFLCVYSVEDLNHAKATKVWGMWVTISSAVGSLIVLWMLFFHVLWSCIFFHKSFNLFIKDKDFSNISVLKEYPPHTRKYLYQYGIIDKKIYEIIKKK